MKIFPSCIIIVFSLLQAPYISFGFPAGMDTTAFVTNPILSCPTDTSMTVRVVPKKALQLYCEYGTTPFVFSNQSETAVSTAKVPVKIVLHNLLPNTRYDYRIRYKETGASSFSIGDPCSFMTQRAKGNKYVFTLTGDSHLYDKKGVPSMMRITMQNILNDHPDFIMEMGDTFGDDHTPLTTTLQDMVQLHLNYMPYLGMIGHSAPFFLVLGNHEGENGYYLLQTPPNNIAVYGTLARKYYYSLPSPNGFYTGDTTSEGYGMGLPENYYAWTWGDALFVVLDAYRYYTANARPRGWDWTLGAQQYDWFKQTLENSRSRYKFVLIHHIGGETRGAVAVAKLYEWGGYEKDEQTWGFAVNRPGWEMPIHQLMVKNGVNIFFQGHDHLFAKEVLDGIVYQEVPMPSDSTYTIGMLANAEAYTSNQLDGSGHLRITVSPDSFFVEYVGAYLPKDEDATHQNGKTRFSYSVKANPTPVTKDKPLPSDFCLEQNYPNPFNPSTGIRYRLKESGLVLLKVFDVSGKEVEILENAWQPPGLHETKFDATNLPCGIYFYHLKINGAVLAKKAVLIK